MAPSWRWLLDTNVLIDAQRRPRDSVANRLRVVPPADLAITTITIAELWYGIARHARPEHEREMWTQLIAPYEALPFDREAAEAHGSLRLELRRQPIGERDLLIASIAVSRQLVVVTRNTREFERVPGLRVEDWSAG